jgi:hypothetical protein
MSPGFHDRMTVSWVSNNTDGSHEVIWGLAADSLNETATATHDTYAADDFTKCMGIPPIKTLDSPFPHLSSHDLRSVSYPPRHPHICLTAIIASHTAHHLYYLDCRCAGSCWDDPTSSQLYLHPGFLHNAVLQPLQPARRYFYKFGSSDGGWSDVYSFISPRIPGDATPFTFLFVQVPHHSMYVLFTSCLGTPPMQASDIRRRKSRVVLATTTRPSMARMVFLQR